MITKLDSLWFNIIYKDFNKPYFKTIFKYLSENKKKTNIYPQQNKIFYALKKIKFKQIKIVIIGQDPYCTPNTANGIAFSVNNNTIITSSLKNIFQEIKNDIKITKNEKITDLSQWIEQGMLLINSILTVEKNKPASHAKIGWELLTDKIIKELSNNKNEIIFVLLGKYAQNKIKVININKDKIISASHPSNRSSTKGFFNSKIFSKTNLHMKLIGNNEIKW